MPKRSSVAFDTHDDHPVAMDLVGRESQPLPLPSACRHAKNLDCPLD